MRTKTESAAATCAVAKTPPERLHQRASNKPSMTLGQQRPRMSLSPWRRSIRILAVPVLAVIVSMLAACGSGPEPDRVVRVESNVVWTEWHQSLRGWGAQFADGEASLLLLRPGALLMSEDAIVPYRTSDGDTLDLRVADGRTVLSDEVVVLNLDEDSAVAWLGRASSAELAALRAVYLNTSPGPAELQALERLAEANPEVGLFFEDGGPADDILPLFRPRLLSVDDVFARAPATPTRSYPPEPQRASWLEQVETLWTSAATLRSLEVLAQLPMLRTLYLAEWDVAEAGPLPVGLSGLESLTLVGARNLLSASAFGPAIATVQELSIVGDDEMDDNVDVSILDSFSRLRSLFLSGTEWTAPSDFAAIEGLRRLGLPENATQEGLAAIVRAHPDLEYLELINVDSVINLSPLRALTRLQAVVLEGNYANIEVLEELPSLRYVGVPSDVWERAPQRVADLRAALPDAVIVKIKEFCLGSGWILLLLPVILFIAFRRPSPSHD